MIELMAACSAQRAASAALIIVPSGCGAGNAECRHSRRRRQHQRGQLLRQPAQKPDVQRHWQVSGRVDRERRQFANWLVRLLSPSAIDEALTATRRSRTVPSEPGSSLNPAMSQPDRK